MKNFVLMEVGRKQNYIFKSNKLKENVGASMIIRHVTEELPVEEMEKNNGHALIQGGGKSFYVFENKENAEKFIRSLSRHVLKNYPNLEVYFVRRELQDENQNMTDFIKELYIALGKKKAQRRGSIRQISFGIEKICASTGLPAAYYKNKENMSDEIYAKVKYYEDNIENYFKEYDVKFHKEFDDLISGEKSYIAIVHIDGNSMGNKFTRLADYYRKKINENMKYNADYLKDFKKLSADIDHIYKEAFKKVITDTVDENGYSKVRPIVIAGDDITFVAKAEDAIRLTKIFIDEIINKKLVIGDEEVSLNAAAGIAFIKSHYPFSRGYELAENLTDNCKHVIKRKKEDVSMIDWHIVQGEDSSSISEIRSRKYRIGSKEESISLNLRPIYVNKKDLHSYEVFKDTLKTIHSGDIARSKLKEYRSELKKGETAARTFSTYYGLNNMLDYAADFELVQGIRDNTAVFFDAIEIMDLVKEV